MQTQCMWASAKVFSQADTLVLTSDLDVHDGARFLQSSFVALPRASILGIATNEIKRGPIHK